MKTYMDIVPENCNYCGYRQKVSEHWDIDDYCFLNKKKTRDMIMDKECPLKSLEGKYINGVKEQNSDYYT